MLNFLKSLFAPPVRKESDASSSDVIGEIRVSLPYPKPPEPPKLPPIELVSPACPYCEVIQDPPPQRRRRCRDCGETIYTKTYRESGRKHLLTAEEFKEIEDDEWDNRWNALDQRVINGTREDDWHTVKYSHFLQALMMFQRGWDHRGLAAESRRGEIRFHRQFTASLDVTHVRVVANEDKSCPDCMALNGLTFTFDEALEQMPIPCPTCTTWTDKNPNGGWCRCYYQAA